MGVLPHSTEADLPGMRAIFEAAQKHRGWKPGKIASHYIHGWVHSQVAVEGIKRAIEKVGLENLTGSAVRDALVHIKGFDVGLVPPLTVTEDKPIYLSLERVYQVREGKIYPHSGWLEPAYHPAQ